MSLSENEAYAANPDESHTRFTNSKPREAIGQPEQAGRPFTQDGLTSITTLLAGLPAAQFHALPQEEYVAQWQEYMNEEYQASEIPQVQRVYCSCLDTYSVLLPVCFNFSASGEDVPESFYRNYILLRDWGSAYLVPEGQLDQLPKEASEVVETIAAFLDEISDILLQRIPKLRKYTNNEKDGSHSLNVAEHAGLSTPLSENAVIAGHDHDSGDEAEMDNMIIDTWDQCTTDISDYVQMLGELHPTIESWVPVRERSPSPASEDDIYTSASMFYTEMIRAKFTTAPSALVEALGELNLERYLRLTRSRIARAGDELPEPAPAVAKSGSFHDSGIGSSLARTQAAPSLAFTLAGASRATLPELPKEGDARPFACAFCGKAVIFKTTGDYRKHLIQDLQPYSCLEHDCPDNKSSFPNQEQWIRHVLGKHDIYANSPSRKCPLCSQMTDAGPVNICKHFANHLEEIALAASPINIVEEDKSEEGSARKPEQDNDWDGMTHVAPNPVDSRSHSQYRRVPEVLFDGMKFPKYVERSMTMQPPLRLPDGPYANPLAQGPSALGHRAGLMNGPWPSRKDDVKQKEMVDIHGSKTVRPSRAEGLTGFWEPIGSKLKKKHQQRAEKILAEGFFETSREVVVIQAADGSAAPPQPPEIGVFGKRNDPSSLLAVPSFEELGFDRASIVPVAAPSPTAHAQAPQASEREPNLHVERSCSFPSREKTEGEVVPQHDESSLVDESQELLPETEKEPVKSVSFAEVGDSDIKIPDSF